MAINLIEALYLLEELGVESVKPAALVKTFLQQPETKTEPEELPPELPEPPKPPAEPTYKTYAEAKKAAKKGQTPVKEGEGYLLV